MPTVYNKLFTKILDSSIWLASDTTRIVWITLIAAMDEDGFCPFATVENLAARARVELKAAKKAVEQLESPEPETATDDDDGRRIERIAGGWLVINADKYRNMVTRIVAREQTRERVRRHRAKKSAVTQCNACNDLKQNVTPSEAVSEAEAYTDQRREGGASLPASADIEQIFNSWNAEAESSKLPKCLLISDKRRRILEARLREPFFISNWQAAITKVGASNFCKGDNNRGWKAGFDWFISSDSVTKLIEGKYDNGTHKPSSTKSFDRNKGTFNEGKAHLYKAKPIQSQTAKPPVPDVPRSEAG